MYCGYDTKLQMRKLRPIREQRGKTALALITSPDGLLVPLNRVPQSRRAQELLELLRTLQEIDHIEAVFAEVDRQLSQLPNYGPDGPARAPFHLYARANEVLSACHWSPRVASPPNEPHSFTWNARTIQSDWENRFVFWMLNLRASGDISLIRTCRNCKRWFYAVTNHQTHCTERCRQQFHSKDKSFKEKRRLYMRRYRKDEKSRNLAALQLVKKDRRSAGTEISTRSTPTNNKKGGT